MWHYISKLWFKWKKWALSLWRTRVNEQPSKLFLLSIATSRGQAWGKISEIVAIYPRLPTSFITPKRTNFYWFTTGDLLFWPLYSSFLSSFVYLNLTLPQARKPLHCHQIFFFKSNHSSSLLKNLKTMALKLLRALFSSVSFKCRFLDLPPLHCPPHTSTRI